MNALVLHVARPITLWALHFIAIYALISAACAPRAVLETDVMRAAAALATLVAGLVVMTWLVTARRRLKRLAPEARERPLAVAAVWSAAISLMAIIADSWPVAFLTNCSG